MRNCARTTGKSLTSKSHASVLLERNSKKKKKKSYQLTYKDVVESAIIKEHRFAQLKLVRLVIPWLQ